MKLTLLLALLSLDAALCQGSAGETLSGGLVGALLNTLFPQLKPNPSAQTRNDPPPLPAPSENRTPPKSASGLSSSVQQPKPSALPLALSGVGRLPPVDFPHGFPPTFVGLTNPDNQNGFNIPVGLRGRTDLPPDYVYPFAQPGSVIKPDLHNGEVYSLGPRASAVSPQLNQETSGGGLTAVGPIDWNRLQQTSLQQPVDNTALLQPIGPSLSLLNSALLAPVASAHAQAAPPGPVQPSNPRLTSPQDALLAPAASAQQIQAQAAPPGRLHSPSPKLTSPHVGSTPSVSTSNQISSSTPMQAPSQKAVPPQQLGDNYGSNCPQCVPVDLKRLAGPWIQVYGNPSSLRNIYTAILNLQSLYGDESTGGQNSVIQPSCIGMQLSRPRTEGGNHTEAAMELHFRDDTINRQLHEIVGVLKQNTNISPKGVILKLPAFELPVCLVKAGPETSTMYGYVVLTETLGANRCRSYHVFARRSDSFFRDHNVEVAEFIKLQVETSAAKPVSVLPFPELCQLPTPNSMITR